MVPIPPIPGSIYSVYLSISTSNVGILETAITYLLRNENVVYTVPYIYIIYIKLISKQWRGHSTYYVTLDWLTTPTRLYIHAVWWMIRTPSYCESSQSSTVNWLYRSALFHSDCLAYCISFGLIERNTYRLWMRVYLRDITGKNVCMR